MASAGLRLASGMVNVAWRFAHTRVPAAVLVTVHGLNECADLALGSPFTTALVESGVDVVALDLVGHGRTPALQGGLPGFIGGLHDACRDVAAAVTALRACTAGESPLYLAGASFGACVAFESVRQVHAGGSHELARAIEGIDFRSRWHAFVESATRGSSSPYGRMGSHQDGGGGSVPGRRIVDGLILQCPLVEPQRDLRPHPVVVKMCAAVARVAPALPVFPATSSRAYHPSIAEERMREDREHPGCWTGPMRAGTGATVMAAAARMSDFVRRQRELHPYASGSHSRRSASLRGALPPLLLQQAGHDLVVDPEAALKFARAYSAAAGEQATVRVYDDAYHDLQRERPHVVDAVVRDALAFMQLQPACAGLEPPAAHRMLSSRLHVDQRMRAAATVTTMRPRAALLTGVQRRAMSTPAASASFDPGVEASTVVVS